MVSSRKQKIDFNKITIYIIASSLVTFIILARLFHLQIIKHDHYEKVAQASQHGEISIPAQRGQILIKDHHSNETFPLATNITLNLLYADPTMIKDPFFITAEIGPLIFDIEEARAKDNERIEEVKKNAGELSPEELEKQTSPLTDQELEKQFKENLEKKLSEKQRSQILLVTNISKEKSQQIRALNLTGIEVIEGNVYAYPTQIGNRATTATSLAPLVEIPSKRLEQILEGKNRYVVLKRKLDPDISEKIKELMKKDKDELFSGLGMKEEYFRYYPEQTLAANVVGYVNHEGIGQYGIESSFNNQLQGTQGKLQSKRDSIGKFITVGNSELEAAVDGDEIVLTIDRSIQMKVEEVLARNVKKFQADSGQILIMNPKTGAVIAMAHYPSYNPNEFGEVFKKVKITLREEEVKNLYPTKTPGIYDFYLNEITLDKYPIFEEIDEKGNKHYYRYENFRGPEVYHNKIVSWPYEPGSVFKTIAMAIAIDDGDITANTTYNDTGPIGVDFNVYSQKYDFEIKNSENKYYGLVNMTTVLGRSLNTSMTFIAKKMGPALFYSYLDKFGFLDRTDIEFDSEAIGRIEYFENWTESELATHAFGQGLTVTMIQVVNAYNVLANGGILMQPHIIEELRHDNGKVTKIEPKEIRRVISENTAAKMTKMLVDSVEEGVAGAAQVEGHLVAGKTGTSQTYKHGKALSGKGTTIGTFAGYGPVNDPQFTILVKFDHPRSSEWGSATAAPTFSEIATFLFDYYNIPPDK